MRDKEVLLSFDSKLRFIFSHAVLKEGWDNPNVFQICTLKDSDHEYWWCRCWACYKRNRKPDFKVNLQKFIEGNR